MIVGGSPCQDLSVAGLRKGFDGERSSLFLEQVRIVKEMREKDAGTGRSGYMVRPRYLVWENVPGAFSSNGGEDFRVVLEEICKIADENASVPRPPKRWSNAGTIVGDGWSVSWRLHDSQFWGTAQRRKRLSVIADFGGLSAPEILFERKGMSRNPEQGRTEWQENPESSGGCFTENHYGDYRGTEQSNSIRASGATCGCGSEALIVKDKLVSCVGGDDVAQTLDASYYKGPGARNGKEREVLVVEPVAYGIDQQGGKGGANFTEDVAPPILSDSHGTPHAVCVPEPTMIEMTSTKNTIIKDGISTTLTARMATGGNQVNAVQMRGSVVRRLTPLEAERLQGMPDNWSKLGVDESGRIYELSDTARYKLQGNGIATPFWRFLMKRISAQYERTPTLGSLFDGQGSFPMIWEGINGPGTALWSSEIDKHAIAVAKYHFPEGG